MNDPSQLPIPDYIRPVINPTSAPNSFGDNYNIPWFQHGGKWYMMAWLRDELWLLTPIRTGMPG